MSVIILKVKRSNDKNACCKNVQRFIELSNSLSNSLYQWTFTCSKLTIKALEKGVKYVQS